MTKHLELKTYPSLNGIELVELNPKSDEALPTLVYFALSAKNSLTLDPFNQPVRFLAEEKIRLLSITLPYHEEGEDPAKAMAKWAENFARDPSFFDKFIENSKKALFALIGMGLIDKEKIALAGLSRGGYAALNLAAVAKEFNTVLAFAPLINPHALNEFESLIPKENLEALSLQNLIPRLVGKHVRIHIGNRDTRVGTPNTYRFVQELTEQSFIAGQRSPTVELLITPSIGHKGHGTSEESFRIGASWIKNRL